MVRRLSHHPWRWYFLATILVLTYPVVVSLTVLSASLSNLLTGTQELEQARSLIVRDPAQAQQLFSQAEQNLTNGVVILHQAPWYTQLLTPLPPFRWQVELTKASTALAASGSITSQLISTYPPGSKSTDPSELLKQTSGDFFQWYTANTNQFDQLQAEITLADQNLQAVPNWIIPGHTRELYNLKQEVSTLVSSLPQARLVASQVHEAFGAQDNNPHTFLVVFQNANELRMSGGFMGSYATLTTQNGQVQAYTFGEDIYKLDAPFTARTQYLPPPQLATLAPTQGFRDSNVGAPGFLADYSPQIRTFYDGASGQTTDGIIYVNSSLLEALLRITGPVTLPGAGTVVTADTVSNALTQYIEKDYFTSAQNQQTDESKSILKDLLPVLLGKLHDQPGALNALLPALQKEVQAKNIQFWATGNDLEKSLALALPADTPTTGNWLKIVQNNLGGLKSSAHVQQVVNLTTHTTFFSKTTEYDVTITRTHHGTTTWPDGDNLNFSEIYLPAAAIVTQLPENQGGTSKLSEADQRQAGIFSKVWQTTVTENSTWKRVNFWSTTLAGQQTVYHLKYRLPNSSQYNDSLSYLKEAGSTNETLVVNGQSYTVDSDVQAQL